MSPGLARGNVVTAGANRMGDKRLVRAPVSVGLLKMFPYNGLDGRGRAGCGRGGGGVSGRG
jgi:hypothetical protein